MFNNAIKAKMTRFTILFLLLFYGHTGYSGSLRHRAKSTKASAPTQEDHAQYFTGAKLKGSKEAWKKADALRLKTIASIKKLLSSNMSDAHKFELYIRLGELYSERHDYLRAVEIDTWEKKYDKWAKKKKGKEPKLSHKQSKAELYKSANSFRKLVRKYPRHHRIDAVLFSLAKTLGRLDNSNAVLFFNQLIKKHPNSTYIPAAHLALGEYYFDKHNIDMAMKSYKAAMKYKNAPTYAYAVYKLGWAYYNASAPNAKEANKNVRKSLAAFKLVIHLSKKNKTQYSNLNLRKEALNDLVMVWSDTEGVDEAWNYFNKLGEKKSFYDMLERLGNIYVEQGENKKAIKTYTRLLGESPNRSRNPYIYVKLVSLFELSNNPEAVVRSLQNMSSLYLGSSSWVSTNRKDKELIKEAAEKTELNIRRYGTLFHQKGIKQKRDNLLSAAAKIYKIYLDHFPKNENAYEIRYYLADIYFNFKKYEAASDQYTIVVLAKPKKGKYLKDSAFNSVVAMNKVDSVKKYPKLPPPGQVVEPKEIPRVKKKLINVIENYVKYLPKEKEGNPMRFAAAQIYFDYGHYDIAIKRFEDIAFYIPKTTQGKSSVKMILGFYSERKRWPDLIKYSRKFLASKSIMASGLKSFTIKNLKYGMYQYAVVLEKSKQQEKAAEAFLAFQKEFPKDRDADRALYNASLNYYKIAQPEKALGVNKKLLSLYPKSPLTPTVVLDIAQTYEALAHFKDAATYYEMFQKRFPKDKRASTALFNSATLYKGLKDNKKSIQLYSRYTKYYFRNSLIPEVHFEIANLMEKVRDYKGAIKHYDKFSSLMKNKTQERSLYAQTKSAELQYLHTNKRKGQRELNRLKTYLLKKNSPPALESRRIIAKTLFDSLNTPFYQFKQQKIRNAKKLQADVKAKQKKLVYLANMYESIIKIGSSEYTVASLYRLGEMHENFANSLFVVSPPPGSTQIQIDQFRTAIEKHAFPLKDESIKFFTGAYNRSREVQTFSEWTRRSYNKLVELSPEKHPNILEKSTTPTYMSHSLLWESSISHLTDSD